MYVSLLKYAKKRKGMIIPTFGFESKQVLKKKLPKVENHGGEAQCF
jgi:hypothetical protein